MMKRIAILALSLAAVTVSVARQLTFEGLSSKPVVVTPEASTGLEAVYVVENLDGCTISYESSQTVVWQRYGNLGGGYAEPVQGVSHQGNIYSISATAGDRGYIIDDGTRRYCFWVVDYAAHQLDLQGLAPSAESDCDRTLLDLQGSAPAITYFSVNGRGVELSRDLSLEYRNLVYDEDAHLWNESSVTEALPSVHGVVSVQAPYCDTDFTLSGDRFLQAWGRAQSVTSPMVTATAVSAVTTATQTDRDADNETNPDTAGGLGGSAPCEITFSAAATDAAVFREWQFSTYAEFDDINERFAQNEVTRIFTDEGTIYARYQCADASGACVFDSPVYTITIGASKLECPNAFSPANQDGINDIWKVSFTSIVSFECHIFNRWGTKMTSFTNPADGWDGRYKGKFVPSGVYFYVIKAKGADGKNYNLSGDINIINSRVDSSSSSSSQD